MTAFCTYFGNPWIGMFIKTNDRLSVLPVDSTDKLLLKAEEHLKTEIVKISVAETNLLGLYTVMNSSGIVLPNLARDEEVAKFRGHGLNVYVSEEKQNAHGNNMAVNDKGGIINPNISPEERKKIGDALGIELVPMTIADFTTLGSACLATNNGFLAHYAAKEDELKDIGSALHVKGSRGTVNCGTGFVSLGAVVNKNGYIAGEKTTAHELGRLEEALDLIK
ncbi:MAG: translation initiation factor IF-6 [Candidatus Micrarchaeota archaeon]